MKIGLFFVDFNSQNNFTDRAESILFYKYLPERL
jgi:hypothetical protein